MSSELDNWAKKYEDLTNSDETIGAMAKYYSCSFMFDMEKVKVIIEMHDGKVKNINTNPGPLDAYDFALRAFVDASLHSSVVAIEVTRPQSHRHQFLLVSSTYAQSAAAEKQHQESCSCPCRS